MSSPVAELSSVPVETPELTREQVEAHIKGGAFWDILSRDVQIAALPGRGTTELELRFPGWYHAHISETSKREIEALVRANETRLRSDVSSGDSVLESHPQRTSDHPTGLPARQEDEAI